jgi:2-keto-3-deoxy-L-rhamnonate aldolase RhmA
VDFVYADMEHSPLDFPGLAIFLAGLTDKAAIVAKKSAQAERDAVRALSTRSRSVEWVVKQALDIGLMGVIFNGVDTKDQALTARTDDAVSTVRGAPRREPLAFAATRRQRRATPGESASPNTSGVRSLAAQTLTAICWR